MNILIVCHDYKEHHELTFYSPNTEPILLNVKNIKNIKKVSNGVINSIRYIDTSAQEQDKIQYNSWDQISSRTKFDYAFLIHCPGTEENAILELIQRNLSQSGKIVIPMLGQKMSNREVRDLAASLFGRRASVVEEKKETPEEEPGHISFQDYVSSGEPYVYDRDINELKGYVIIKEKINIPKKSRKTATKKQSAGRRKNRNTLRRR